MKELVVISGKGGTGKTSIVGSLAALAENKVLADCDVDASDLHLLLQPEIVETHDFYGPKKAQINEELCDQCNLCMELCRFHAIKDYQVNWLNCEGCAVCYYMCPQKAITMVDHVSGQWYTADSAYGPLVFAQLGIGEEHSGKLVTEVRKRAVDLAKREAKDLVIIDGPPGVGCPVIASLTGADLVLVVTEPTVAGIHDLERVLELARHFKVEPKVCINKWDLAENKAREIELFCEQRQVELVGKIPYDAQVSVAITDGEPPIKYVTGETKEALEKVWEKLRERLVG